MADTPRDAANGADAVVTMVIDAAAVEAVMTGDDGALAAELVVARRLGVDPATVLDTVAGSAVDAPYVQVKGSSRVCPTEDCPIRERTRRCPTRAPPSPCGEWSQVRSVRVWM